MASAHEEMNDKRYLKMGYQKIFGIPGTDGHAALEDFATYCRVFDVAIHDHDASLDFSWDAAAILSHLAVSQARA